MPDFFFAGVNQPASNFIPPVGADAGAFVPGVLPPTPPPPPSGPAPSAPVTLPPATPIVAASSSGGSTPAFQAGGGDPNIVSVATLGGVSYGYDPTLGSYVPLSGPVPQMAFIPLPTPPTPPPLPVAPVDFSGIAAGTASAIFAATPILSEVAPVPVAAGVLTGLAVAGVAGLASYDPAAAQNFNNMGMPGPADSGGP